MSTSVKDKLNYNDPTFEKIIIVTKNSPNNLQELKR
jgi:hypothetical protein